MAVEKFGRYRLLEQIAAGGMGEIFLARSTSIDGFDKELVIKRILPQHGASENFVSMFLDEARVTMTLSHQNIVQVFDFGQTEGRYFLAMEFVYGADLRTILKLPQFEGKGIPVGLALYILAEVCKALDYAHNKRGRTGEPLNLVHRDISPDNIMVGFDGGVKITDFGIAKAKGQMTELGAGAVIGKIAYMGPEQASGSHVDERSDIFSCGAVLWELMTGRKLYEPRGETDEQYYERVCYARTEVPSKYNKSLPRKIDKLIMKAIAGPPDMRYGSAREFAAEIQELHADKYRRSDAYALQAFMDDLKGDLKVLSFEGLEPSQASSLMNPSTSASALNPSSISANTPEPPLTSDLLAPAPLPPPKEEPPPKKTASSELLADQPPELVEAARGFLEKPSLWELVRMGDICVESKMKREAVACFRVAAVKFAQHGLLPQSLLCAKQMLEHGGSGAAMTAELASWPALLGRNDERIVPYLFRTGGTIEELLAELVVKTTSDRKVATERSPLLHHISGEGFALLAHHAPLRRFEPGQHIVVQGDEGRTLFLLLSGRALVSVRKASGESIYVASFAAGDFFGEKSFFSRAPRSATVEAMDDVAVIEIDQELYDRVMSGSPEAAKVLQRFYKERVVDSILATSPTFGVLPSSDRRTVLAKLELKTFEAGQALLQKGRSKSDIHLLKRGSVEIRDADEVIDVVGPGTIIGEKSAPFGNAPAISAIASGPVEAFALAGSEMTLIFSRSAVLANRWRTVALEDWRAPNR